MNLPAHLHTHHSLRTEGDILYKFNFVCVLVFMFMYVPMGVEARRQPWGVHQMLSPLLWDRVSHWLELTKEAGLAGQ